MRLLRSVSICNCFRPLFEGGGNLVRALIPSVVPVFLVVFLYPSAPFWFSRGHVREPFMRIVQVALGLGLPPFVVHAFPLRLLNIPKRAEVIDFVLSRPFAFRPLPRAMLQNVIRSRLGSR